MSLRRDIASLPDKARLGIDLIDADHLKVFAIMNRLKSSHLDDQDQIGLLEALEDCILSHFSREEQFMRTINYQGYSDHKKAHESFIRELEGVWSKVSEEKNEDIREFIGFLENWWHQHILKDDRQYADWLAEKLDNHKKNEH